MKSAPIYINKEISNFNYPYKLANTLYNFPIDYHSYNGKGQKIGILTGGEWFIEYANSDNNFSNFIKNYLSINIPELNKNLKIILHDPTKTQNYYSHPENALSAEEGEALLDISIILSCCPALEEIHIFPYSIANAIENGKKKILTNIKDYLILSRKLGINVISCSYGSYISVTDEQDDEIFKDFSDITICVASGDNGGCNTITSTQTKCDRMTLYPSYSKYVLSVGGTQFTSTIQTQIPTDMSQQAWFDSPGLTQFGGGSGGGGISPLLRPKWQNGANLNTFKQYRLVPDVAGLAQSRWYLPVSTQQIKINSDGSSTIPLSGGTSAVAPMYAAFFVIVNQEREKQNKPPIGFVNNYLYKLQFKNENLFDDIVDGKSTAGYKAKDKYDLISGLGIPKFDNILKYLTNLDSIDGSNGSYGSQGSQRSQGSHGSKGSQGSQHSQGSHGSNGSQGSQGSHGSNGSNGSQGSQRSQGNHGGNGSYGSNSTIIIIISSVFVILFLILILVFVLKR